MIAPSPVPEDEAAPAHLTLLQNTPNPFNPTTEIRFGLPEAQQVSLRIYNSNGRLVKTLLEKQDLGAGYHRVSWNGCDNNGQQASSGIYLYRLSSKNERISVKMTLLK